MHLLISGLLSVYLLLCYAEADSTTTTEDVPSMEVNSIDGKTQNENEALKQVWEKRCSRQYSVGCLKLDLVRLVDRLDVNTSIQILPGVSLVKLSSGQNLGSDIITNKQDSFLDNYLISKFANYLSSLTINVKILDPAVVNTAKSFGDGLFGPDPETTATARKRNRFGSTLATAGLMSGATLLAVGMSALAAMAGKALMTSLLSLMLSALAALKGHGDGGHKSTTYEIVTKPIVTHAHTHSSEVQHMTGHGGHGSHDSGYGYARSMASTPVQPVIQDEMILPNSTPLQEEDGNVMSYRPHEPLPSSALRSSATTPTVSSYYPIPTHDYEYRPYKYQEIN